jgi:hypothetical protein
MRRVARCVCEKIAQNVAQLIFLSKLIHNIYLGKSGVKMWANSEIFKNLTKANNPTLGANSPNLVTLFCATSLRGHCLRFNV